MADSTVFQDDSRAEREQCFDDEGPPVCSRGTYDHDTAREREARARAAGDAATDCHDCDARLAPEDVYQGAELADPEDDTSELLHVPLCGTCSWRRDRRAGVI